MIFEHATVIGNTNLGPGYCRIGIRCDRAYESAVPGQFVMARLPGRLAPFLSRPFSIHRLVKTDDRFQGIEILVKIVGRATLEFSDLKPGSRIQMLGPLGNGFTAPPPGRPFWLVAGGVGAAPLVFLAEFLTSHTKTCSPGRVFVGAKTAADVLGVLDFQQAGLTVDIATEDGSLGVRGLVTDLLSRALKGHPPSRLFACGPKPMLRAVAALAHDHGTPCQVSLETIMACGMGACLGCAVESGENNANRFFHACKDGPVFPGDAIRL